MKAKRQITALFTAILLLLACVLPVSAALPQTPEYDSAEYYLNFLTKIGITDSTLLLDDVVTRKDFALFAARLLGEDYAVTSSSGRYLDVDNTEAYASMVEELSNLGIFSGDGNGYFHPDRPITAHEATKVIVELLGYRYLARDMGAFPNGYLFVANRLKLLDGVSVDDGYITGSDFVRLVYNSLEVDTAEVAGVSVKGDDYYQIITTVAGNTILSGRLNLYRGSGVVKSYYPVSIASETASEGEVIIGDSVVHTGDEDISGFLGCSVNYVYHLKDNVKTLAYIELDEQCDVEVLIGSKQVEVNGMKLSYYNENDKKVTVSVSPVADILYNFQKVGYEEKYIENLNYAKIELIDNGDDNIIDFISVEPYNTLMVGDKSANLQTLFDKTNPTKQLSLNPDDYDKIIIVGANDEKVSFDEIAAGSVVTYACSDSMLKCYISNEMVSGMVESAKTGEYTEYAINGKYYKKSPLMSDTKSYIGFDVKAYLDVFGFIAFMDKKVAQEENFAYLLDTNRGEGFSVDYAIKLFLDDKNGGKAQGFDCADLVQVNGVPTKEKDLPVDIPQGVVAYQLNEKGEINRLETVVAKKAFEEGRLYCGIEGTSVFYYQANQSFGGKMLYNNATVLFQISVDPESTGNIEEDDIRIKNINSLTTDTSYNVKFYSTSNDGVADAGLLYSSNADTISDASENLFAVKSAGYALDENGDSYYYLEGYVTGTEKKFKVHKDYLNTLRAMNIQPGDVLRYMTRGAKEELALVQILYRADGGWQLTNPYPSGAGASSVPFIIHGTVVGVNDSYIYYTRTEDYSAYSGILSDCYTYPKYRWSTISVIEQGNRTTMVRSGTMDDIEPGDEIINYVWKLHPLGFALIKK